MSTIPLTRHTINIDGRVRVFFAYWPVVPLKGAYIGCHGSGMRGKGFAEGGNRNFVLQAEEGYAGVFPNSGDNEFGNHAWPLDGPLYEQNRVFLHTLREHLLNKGAPGVGLLGNSSGGYNTWIFRTDDAHRDQGQFCWYAPGAANLPKAWAKRMLPAPTFIPHGTADSTVPFEGTETQLGWEDAVKAVFLKNNGVEATTIKEDTERSCAGRKTTFVVPAAIMKPSPVPLVGAKVVNGHHSWHACDRWQMQQKIMDWSDRLGLWVPNPDYTDNTTPSVTGG